MYDFGRRKLLRKCENRRFPNFIVSIQSQVPLLLFVGINVIVHASSRFRIRT